MFIALPGRSIDKDFLEALDRDIELLRSSSPATASAILKAVSEPQVDVAIDLTLDTAPVAPRPYGFSAYDVDGSPITWAANRFISVTLDPTNMAYPQFIRDAAEAIRRINLVGALHLRLIGHDGSNFNEGDIRIRWVNRPEMFNHRSVGESHVTTRGIPGRVQITSALINLCSDARQRPGFVKGGWGITILHELMHALGADHTDDPDQLMNAVNVSATDLGVGDRYCLKLLAETARRRAGTAS
jgi:hypothetical protein